MCSVEADLLPVLGHMPGEEEDIERKLVNFDKEKDKLWTKKFDEQKKLNAQLSRHQLHKEQEEWVCVDVREGGREGGNRNEEKGAV